MKVQRGRQRERAFASSHVVLRVLVGPKWKEWTLTSLLHFLGRRVTQSIAKMENLSLHRILNQCKWKFFVEMRVQLVFMVTKLRSTIKCKSHDNSRLINISLVEENYLMMYNYIYISLYEGFITFTYITVTCLEVQIGIIEVK